MKELTLKASLENIRKITDFVEEELADLKCPVKSHMHIVMAIDELISNVAHYAYGLRTGDVKVIFDYDKAEDTIIITFIDRGIPFNPLEVEEPDISLDAHEREIGGLGIFMVKKMMDDIEYRYEDDCNILTIKKRIRE